MSDNIAQNLVGVILATPATLVAVWVFDAPAWGAFSLWTLLYAHYYADAKDFWRRKGWSE